MKKFFENGDRSKKRYSKLGEIQTIKNPEARDVFNIHISVQDDELQSKEKSLGKPQMPGVI